MEYFKYGSKEVEYLNEKDPILGAEIDKIGHIKREVNSDIFSSLISSIISQQISTKAAITVENRLIDLLGEISPQSILNGAIDLENLHKLSDQEVVKELVELKGVGEWTAEMLLIHSLQRPNVLSYKDLGIRRGIMRLYTLDDLSKEEFEVYRKRYSPYNTVASIYLWKISEN